MAYQSEAESENLLINQLNNQRYERDEILNHNVLEEIFKVQF